MADTTKPTRLCIGCGQHDDHPRHVIGKQEPWHMDCHVLATGCGTCSYKLEAVGTSPEPDGVIGDELHRRLLDAPLVHVVHLDDNPAGPVEILALADSAQEG